MSEETRTSVELVVIILEKKRTLWKRENNDILPLADKTIQRRETLDTMILRVHLACGLITLFRLTRR